MPSAVRLDDAIREFITSRRARGLSANTLRSEESCLNGFLTVVGNIYPRNIGTHHVDMWLSANSHWEPASRRQQINRLSAFQSWLWNRRYAQRGEDFLADVRRVRVPEKRRQRIPAAQFGELLDRAVVPRDRMIVALGLFLLVRTSEMVTIRWRDVHDEHVEIYRRKTMQPDELPICPDLRVELDRWERHVCKRVGVTRPEPDWYVVCAMQRPEIRNRRGIFLPGVGEYPLLPGQSLRQPRPRVQKIMRQIGVNEPGTGMHTLRRSGARAMFELLLEDGVAKDKALMIVSSMLGHSKLELTLGYIGWETTRAMRNEIVKNLRMVPGEGGDGNVIPFRRKR